ncbi:MULTISPECIES: ribonuclease P protein component [unclassified Ruminococcus]|uniref:ribonuclease P protein component n=1 Tax=unclassified Ruminococcus TaxID=2608920 RepID=UPI00210966C3|nr:MULTISPECIES: ribonuclease P protein component [unclassified Ruminococcus]MCQ4021959.1 ribonuclease P protein component [Ruminococcus sp. zg-924]MCQ4114495.1 ribonuclease P protein component [Ruminococcus sp. zg-921]
MTEIVKIKENRDFQRIYKKGKSFVSPVLVTYVFKNRSRNVRYGITTSKKTGNAVQRNRSRRIIRAAFAEISEQIPMGYDFIFVARGKTSAQKSTDIVVCMLKQLKQAGVF